MPFRPDRLKSLREAKKLSQEQLGMLAGVSHSFIAKIENGKSVPGSEVLDKLTRALDSSIDYLHGRGYDRVEPATAAAQMAFEVFASDPLVTAQQSERCRPALAHSDAPKTALAWRSFAEMMDLVSGPARVNPSNVRLSVVRDRQNKSKA